MAQSVPTMIASASLILSGAVFWVSISNRTEDRINGLETHLASMEGIEKSNSQRLDRDEAWISELISKRMK